MAKKNLNKKVGKNNNTLNKDKDILYGQEDQYYLLQTLIDNIPDNIYIKDKKCRFIMVNKMSADSLKKKPEDIIGKTSFDFYPQEEAKEYFKDDNQVMKSGKPIIDKVEKETHSGKEFWFSTSKIPWYDRNGNIMGTMGISRDVTKRKKSDESLLGREKSFFNAFMNNMADSIFFKDLGSRFVRINRACAIKHEMENPEEAIGKTDFDFFSEEHASQAFEDEQKVIKTNKPIIDFEEKETYEDREDRWASTSKLPWYDENNNIIGIFGITRDITDHKIIENKLEKEISFMNALMERIPDSIYFKDNKSRFVRINKALAEKFGLKDPSDVVGKTDFDFFSKKLAKIRYDGEQQVIKTGRHILNEEKIEIIKNKEDRWTSATKLPWYDENNNIIGIFGITRDVTDKKKAEEKVKYLSFHDGLTGLYNRAYFDEEFKRLDTERQLPITIVMGDLNGLKVINDAYGHSEGDMLLKKIADILKESFRKEDIISRWGGDEFIAILPKTSTKDTKNIIRRIKELCKEKSTTEMPLSISLGISTKKSPSENIDDILKEAEDKMYKNKILESTPIHESLIQSLRLSLKKGDYRTETSIKKMGDYAILIGKRLNLSSIKLEELKLLMNLHNIGKLALADEIMTKKGRLTAEEWKIIKEIPEIGYRIAESSTKLKPIAESILSHHEWYNGQGYPRGIRGEEIPVLSRISFLINSYDAMTSDRPYRKRMTEEEAKKEIKKFSGIQFDPKIVETFFELLEGEGE